MIPVMLRCLAKEIISSAALRPFKQEFKESFSKKG